MSQALEILRAALAGTRGWLVGGMLRDRALGRQTADLDVVLADDPRHAARAIARTARTAGVPAAAFPLSEKFGAWRVVARDGSWQVDVEALRGGSIEADLALRDFTVNAIAEPISGGAPVDPLGGLVDLAAGCLRMASERAFEDDPLRVLRLVRIAVELGFNAEPATLRAAASQAHALARVSPERVFAELQRIVSATSAPEGLELMARLGATAVVLPELETLRGVQQSSYHHRDVHGHTIEVLQRTIELQADPGALLGSEHAEELAQLLAEPLADGLTRGDALRWGALLHDAAKPTTREERPGDGRITFIGHDSLGADLASELLARLRTSVRLREHVAALVRHHLRLGFLVHAPQPLERETVYDYLRATGSVGVDVTLLSVADRLATRGARSEESIQAHLHVARQMLPHALRWRAEGAPKPLLRGDELATELHIEAGPRLGELLEQLARAQYAGVVSTREQALAFARRR
ncbi:MAG: HD domain-containing protein [Solirubrobacteraceae bacterium]